jgi:tRNA threonylcarbamoyladenosine biosynthesis protein TsaE
MKYIAKNESETVSIGRNIANMLNAGDILCLYGDLGAGKTTLVKGVARGLGIKKQITSPTFALMNIYPIKPAKLVHVDTYRLKDEQELVDIGIEDYLGASDAICIIEWPEKMKKLLKKKKTLKIEIEHLRNGRRITVSD